MLRPTDRLARTLLAPTLVFVATAIDRNYQTDLWHHLARGRILIEEGVLANSDRFTFTVTGEPLRDVNWAWQAAFYCLYRLGGLPLVQTVNSALLALVIGLLGAFARRKCGSTAIATGTCIVAFLGIWPLLIIRPQTVSLLLFVLLQCALDAAVLRRRWLLAAPVLMAIWVNFHGGFPIGLVLIGANALAIAVQAALQEAADIKSRIRNGIRASTPYLIGLACSAAATLANPYGWHVYEYVGVTSGRAATRHLDEWLPPGLDSLSGKVFALSLAATLVLGALSGRGVDLKSAIVAGCFLPFASGSVRMVAWWFLVWVPLFAQMLATCWPRLRRVDDGDDVPSLSAGLVAGALAVVAVLSLPALERWNPVFLRPGRSHRTETDLQAAADQITSRSAARVFTRFAWGEYLGWALAECSTVFMDGRIEIYPADVWEHYAAITRGRADWQELLDEYHVDCLLLDESGYDAALLAFVRRSSTWREVFGQGNAVLFVRADREETNSPQTRRLQSPDLRAVANH
jgi:hypothetical protein